jgi:MFS family permease
MALDAESACDSRPYPEAREAWVLLGALVLAYMLAFIDRLILALLVEPIKADLLLSDVEISLLQGFAFAFFYVVAGLPAGRIVDSASRTRLIGWAVSFWSLMTCLCGLAANYWQLFLARVGVGVGEAVLVPAAYSVIPDVVPRQRLALAMGIFSAGAALGAGIALLVGGVVIQLISAGGARTLPLLGTLEPWQLTFIVVGAPGLLVALIFLVIREPARRGRILAGRPAPISAVVAFLRAHRMTMLLHHGGNGLASMATFAIMSWAPTFLIRNHGWSPAEVGAALGGAILCAGIVGVIGGGWLADWLASSRSPAARLSVGAGSMFLAAVGAVAYPITESPTAIVLLFTLTILGAYALIAPSAAALQEIVPNELRGQTAAIFLFVLNLLGMAAGPTVLAVVTEYVFRDPAALPYSLAIVPPLGYLLGGVLLLLARRPYAASLTESRRWRPENGD